MAPVVRISDVNWERLKRWAVPLEDSADDALGKVLDAAESQSFRISKSGDSEVGPMQAESDELSNCAPDSNEQGARNSAIPQRRRRRKRQNISQAEYELAIIESISKLGGQARVSDVLDEVEQRMKHSFEAKDYEYTSSGTEMRWRNAARWARSVLVKKGLLKSDSEQGVWELTPQGDAEARGQRQQRP